MGDGTFEAESGSMVGVKEVFDSWSQLLEHEGLGWYGEAYLSCGG